MIAFVIFGTIYVLCVGILVTVLVAGRPMERRDALRPAAAPVVAPPPSEAVARADEAAGQSGSTRRRPGDMTRSSTRWPSAPA